MKLYSLLEIGQIDMLADYQIDEKALRQMTMTVCAGVAAGYEALKMLHSVDKGEDKDLRRFLFARKTRASRTHAG